MPKRISRRSRKLALSSSTGTRTAPRGASGQFTVGDVVVTSDDKRDVGTICAIVNPGVDYMIMLHDAGVCALTPHGTFELAPIGTAGPNCTDDCH